MEFSKKLLIFSWTVTLIMTAATVWVSLKSLPLDGLMIVTPLSWAASDVATGFYLWKSKNENRAKYAQKFLNEFAKEWGAETAARMAEIVLKD